MLNELNLPDLRLRRKIARLSLLFKIDSGVIPLALSSDVIRKEIRRTDNSKSYSLIACRSHPYYGSFYPKTIRDWNDLPEQVVAQSKIEPFLAKLKAKFVPKQADQTDGQQMQ